MRFHGEPGRIELVACEAGDPKTDWFVQHYSGGVMILDDIAGRTFVSADQLPDYEQLEFVSREKAS